MHHRGTAASAALLLAALLAVAGCGSGQDRTADLSGGAAEAQAEDSAPEAPADRDGGAGDGEEGAAREDAGAAEQAPDTGTASLAPAHLIRTAEITVVTEDVEGGYDRAVELTEEAGGWVSAEQTDREDDGSRLSRITLQVPPERYERLLADLSRLGELRHREVSTEDVTGTVVDVESRIATQEESVARVRALMKEAGKLSDIVALEAELSTRQADLEALKARLASLREQTGTATVSLVLLEPDRVDEEEEEDSGGPSVGGALAAGWGALKTTLLWTAVVIGAVLPFAAALLLLEIVRRLLVRWLPERLRPTWPRRRGAVPPPPVAAPAPMTQGGRPQEPARPAPQPPADS
ncbi:DUF4349 domain-containing protein [Streptomyces sodiiphilus]|uniref:DUF4349 domain-containing protein n=1 Tax=Streptomyces sodiiphilus TaxID=226217 RepID=A0ABN2P399_9ACTN